MANDSYNYRYLKTHTAYLTNSYLADHKKVLNGLVFNQFLKLYCILLS